MDIQEILESYEFVSDFWKEKIRKKYPEYFEDILKEGNIYIFENIIFQYYSTLNIHWYTIDFEHSGTSGRGYFLKNSQYCKKVIDEKTILKLLTEEAIYRGYKEGVRIDRTPLPCFKRIGFNNYEIVLRPLNEFKYDSFEESLIRNAYRIYNQGVWAHIL